MGECDRNHNMAIYRVVSNQNGSSGGMVYMSVCLGGRVKVGECILFDMISRRRRCDLVGSATL